MVEEIEFAESKGETKTEKKDDGLLNIPDSIMETLPFA
jgi:hypothetical protein